MGLGSFLVSANETAGSSGAAILGKWFGDEDAGVVDERVDAPKPAETFGNRAFGRLPIGDVAGDDQDVGVARGPNRPCRRDYYTVVAIEVRFDERRADTPRRTSDNSNLLFGTHRKISLFL
jgi:hypothetical protein